MLKDARQVVSRYFRLHSYNSPYTLFKVKVLFGKNYLVRKAQVGQMLIIVDCIKDDALKKITPSSPPYSLFILSVKLK